MKKIALQIALFVLVLTGHLFYANWQTLPRADLLFGQGAREFILLYIRTVSFIPGLAYALMASFLGFSAYKYYIENKKQAALRGVLFSLMLFSFLYFALGLNGSFLFSFYVRNMSWIYSSLMKPLFLLITILSVAFGYIYIWRKAKKV